MRVSWEFFRIALGRLEGAFRGATGITRDIGLGVGGATGAAACIQARNEEFRCLLDPPESDPYCADAARRKTQICDVARRACEASQGQDVEPINPDIVEPINPDIVEPINPDIIP